jgi:outer membrane lipoprotein-sorting protein
MREKMRHIVLLAAVAAVCLPAWAAAQDAKADPKTVPATDSVNADEIIHKFAAKEAEFKEARNNYTYRQTVKLEELDPSGNPSGGKWEEIDDIYFTTDGKRAERVVYAPVQTLRNIMLTPEDVADLRNVQPFVLTTADIGEYILNYVGREKLDEIGTYEFSVKPKKLTPGKRYFQGTVWVDDRDLQIVKSDGKGVGELKSGSSKNQAFPKFETYREQIDGKYWFPTYTHADDTLHFKDGQAQRIRMTVKYQDYKHYEGKSTIRYGDVVDDTKNPTKKK